MSDELLEICRQCGTIYQYVLDLARDQLLIEVEEFSAMRLFNKFKRAPPQLGGYSIRVAATTRQEMIRAQVESHEKVTPQKSSATKTTKGHDFNPSYLRAEGGSTSAVLCAHVDKETAEVKHDVLRQAFAKYGRVVCLVSYRYKDTLHCLVQYSDIANAAEGLRKLNGMHIYDDCCILRVFYSNLPNLALKDDGRGYRKLVQHNPQVELSRKTVAHLQVWNPNKGGTTEQKNRTKEASRKAIHVKVKGNVAIDRIPKIPKLSAINSGHGTQRSLQPHNDTGSDHHGTNVTTKSKDPKPNQTISRQSSDVSKGYYKVNYTPIRPKVASNHKHQSKGSGKLLPLIVKKLPSPVAACDSSNKNDEATTTNTVKVDLTNSSSNDQASSNDRNGIDRPSSLDVAAFTLSLDPSDGSDIDTDGSGSIVCNSKRLTNLHSSVEIAVGCQEIVQPSTGTQCSMEDEDLEKMATSWREQLDEFKKQSSDIAEMEGRIKELLLENANLKRLLNEVHGEMRQLKEIISSVTQKADASTQVDPTIHGTVAEDEVQHSIVTKCSKLQQTDKQIDSFKSSVVSGSRNYKRSSPCSDPTYEPYKKKQKKRSKSSSPPSSMASPKNNSEKTTGYALKIRNKFLHTHLQSFLKLQKFIKSKLDAMKETMRSCNADLHKLMSKIVPQLENLYDITVELANLEQSSNEDELFSCITKLFAVFPSLIADFSDGSLALKEVSGLSPLTILSTLKKMEYLANEMNKYIPKCKTLAYGNANTGETTSLESSYSSGCNVATNRAPPPLLSLDDAVEMLDEELLQQQTASESLECVTSLTVSISTKFLHKVGGKRLFSTSDDNVFTEVTENGGPSGIGDEVQIEDRGEDKEQEAGASSEESHNDVCTASIPHSDGPFAIELVQNKHYSTNSEETAGETPNKESSNAPALAGNEVSCLPDNSASVQSTVLHDNNSNNAVISSATSVNQSTGTTPTNSTCVTSPPMPTYSTNQNTNNAVAQILPPFSAIPSNQSYPTTIIPVHNSAPPTYTSNNFYNQPHLSVVTSGGFTPLLPQPYIPIPIINISQSIDGLVVKWTLEQLDIHLASQVHSYCLCVFQGDRAPDPDFWHTIGEVQAMKLPMACTLKYFEKGKTYHFAVQAISRDGTRGQFSQSKIIQIY